MCMLSRCITPHILNLGTMWTLVVSLIPWLLYSQGKIYHFPKNRWLVGPQSQSGHSSEEKNSYPCQNLNCGHPSSCQESWRELTDGGYNLHVIWIGLNWNDSSCGPVTWFCLSGVEPSGSNFRDLLVSALLNYKLSVTVDNEEDWKNCFPLSSSHLFTEWTRHLVFSVPGKCSFLSYLICFVHWLCQAFCFE